MPQIENNTPYYYAAARHPTDLLPLSMYTNISTSMLSEAAAAGGVIQKKFWFSTLLSAGGQVTIDAIDITINSNTNTIDIIGKNPSGSIISFATGISLLSGTAMEAQFAAVMTAVAGAFGVTPVGWMALGIIALSAGGTAFVHHTYVDDIIKDLTDAQAVAGAADVDIRLHDASGSLVSGAYFRNGLGNNGTNDKTQVVSALTDMILAGGTSTNDNSAQIAIAMPNFKFDVLLQEGSSFRLVDTYTVYDGKVIEDIADFYEVNVQTLFQGRLALWTDNVSENPYQLFTTNSSNSWIVSTATDRLSLNIDGNSGLPNFVQFHVSDITTNVAIFTGTQSDNLILGTAGRDLLRGESDSQTAFGNDVIFGGGGDDLIIGALGADLLYGGAGNDAFTVTTSPTALSGDLYHGGDFKTDVSNDGQDRVDYFASRFGVKVDLSGFHEGTAQRWDSNSNTVSGPVDRLVSIENITGSFFHDLITGSAGNNILKGDFGDDIIRGGAGNDTLDGESGTRDVADYSLDPAGVNVDLGLSIATDGWGDVDTLKNFEHIMGSAFNDTLKGSVGDDVIFGNAGNDVIRASAGIDNIFGGDGDDTLTFEGLVTPVTISFLGYRLGDGSMQGMYSEIENIILGSGNDRVETDSTIPDDSASSDPVLVDMGTGFDAVVVSGGVLENGVIYSAPSRLSLNVTGFEIISGGGLSVRTLGNSFGLSATSASYQEYQKPLIIDYQSGTVSDGQRTDLFANKFMNFTGTDLGDTIIFPSLGTGKFYLGLGDDTVSGVSSFSQGNSLTYSGGNDHVFGTSTVDSLRLEQYISASDVTITELNHRSKDIRLSNGDPATQINFELQIEVAGRGSITFHNQIKFVSSEGEIIGSGVPQISLADGRTYNNHTENYDLDGLVISALPLGSRYDDFLFAANGYDGNDTITGTSWGSTGIEMDGGNGNDTLLGGSDSEVLWGGWGDDVVSGGAGQDMLHGSFGDDLIEGGDGDDLIFGEADDDTLKGGNGNDYIEGNIGNDSLEGGAGNDRLIGGRGVDIIDGGAGNDILEGGEGDDQYIFAAGGGDDVIIDGSGFDTLALSGNLTLANLRFSQVGEDLVIGIASGVTIKGQFSGDPSRVVDVVSFSDGSKVNLPNPFMQTNQPPIAVGDEFSVNEDTLLVDNVMANDSDPDGDTLDVLASTLMTASGGTVVLHENGDFTYTPVLNFHGSDSFDYTLSDALGETDTATVTITVSPVNDAPLATDDSFTSMEDASLAGNLLSNDLDVDDIVLSALAGTFTTLHGGTVAIAIDGSFIYTAATNFNGMDSFDYTVRDTAGSIDTGKALVNVTPVNDGPDAKNDNFTVTLGHQVNGNLLSNNGHGADTDIDGNPLSVQPGAFTTAQGHSVTINANGTFTYIPAFDFLGTDSFSYTLNDGQGGTDTATAYISVKLPAGAKTGHAGTDILFGGNGDNVIAGLGGDDLLYGGKGHDIILGGEGSDLIFGGKGNDKLSGGAGDDFIHADGGKDELYGGTGDDWLMGSSDDDILHGDAGRDTLLGGGGKNTYVFERDTAFSGADTIMDFDKKRDQIDISDVLHNFDPLHDVIAHFVKVTTSQGKTTLSVDADGTDNGAHFVAITIIQGAGKLDLASMINQDNLVI